MDGHQLTQLFLSKHPNVPEQKVSCTILGTLNKINSRDFHYTETSITQRLTQIRPLHRDFHYTETSISNGRICVSLCVMDV